MTMETQPAGPEPEIRLDETGDGACPMIEIEGLTKLYGANKALDNISFRVKRGEVMGFLGPNGAGKSTTMNILTGYLAASGGKVRIDGVDAAENPEETRRKIGYLPEQPPLYPDMTVREYLSFVYDLKGIRRPDKAAHLRKVMERVKVTEVQGRLIQNLSKGYRQRVGLAQALIGDPEVLVLDEPTVGLDPGQILDIRQVIRELGRNRTVILSTHILQEVSAVCDSYTIINRGKIAACGRMDELGQGGGEKRYLLRVKGPGEAAAAALAGTDGLEGIEERLCSEEGAAELLLTSVPEADIREAVFLRLAAAGCPMLSFAAAVPSFEERFMQIISADDTQAFWQEREEDIAAKPVSAAEAGTEEKEALPEAERTGEEAEDR